MTIFREWCEKHAPGFYEKYGDRIFENNSTIWLIEKDAKESIKKIRRPAHETGIPLAFLKKEIFLLPGCIHYLGPFMKSLVVNEQGAWMGSCGKDILPQAIVQRNAQEGDVAVVKFQDFYVGIGKVLPSGNERALKMICDVGRFLHR